MELIVYKAATPLALETEKNRLTLNAGDRITEVRNKGVSLLDPMRDNIDVIKIPTEQVDKLLAEGDFVVYRRRI